VAESKASKLASGYTSKKVAPSADDLKGMPANVQEAVLDVVRASVDLGERVALAEEVHAVSPEHELALDPETHDQSTRAYRFEVVDDEIVEIRKDSHDAPVQIIYHPEMTLADEIDPLAELTARLQAPEEE
jgi:hypothetical protein